jgi:cytosine/adenosine deaminase-related metal-dependent hydrolase
MPSRLLRARWILPIDRPPIARGWIEVDGGRVLRVGDRTPPADAAGAAEDLGDVALMPGLVNAHTHLELSWMAGRVPPAATMDEWIRTLIGVRLTGPDGGQDEADRAARDAAASMRASGTVLVGDISNGLTTPPALRAAGLGGVVFHELLGFGVVDPAPLVRDAWLRARAAEASVAAGAPPIVCSVVAHAPYSVSPVLFREIARQAQGAPLSVHLAESKEEIEFVRAGSGPIRDMLAQLGAWTGSWTAPGSDPVTYLSSLGYLGRGVLVVHGVHLTEAGLDALREMDAVLVACPRSNTWVGGGLPPVARFYGSGVRVAIGTDSLASVATLNVFDELAELRRIAPEVTAAKLLESATRVGAAALGFGDEFGAIAPGMRASFVSVDVPAGVSDVEEYLVGGVAPGAVRPLEC